MARRGSTSYVLKTAREGIEAPYRTVNVSGGLFVWFLPCVCVCVCVFVYLFVPPQVLKQIAQPGEAVEQLLLVEPSSVTKASTQQYLRAST